MMMKFTNNLLQSHFIKSNEICVIVCLRNSTMATAQLKHKYDQIHAFLKIHTIASKAR